jgi:hypothetical protein
MSMARSTLLAFAAAAVVSAAFAAPASAGHTPQPTWAQVVGPVKIDKKDPTVAYIKAKYRCTGEGSLWISVKQTAARDKDPALMGEGSSAISAAWSMSHRNAVTCDGKAHFGHFVVDQVETHQFGIPYAPLMKGWGWVQFCLFDANYPAPLPGQENSAMPFINDGFHAVR